MIPIRRTVAEWIVMRDRQRLWSWEAWWGYPMHGPLLWVDWAFVEPLLTVNMRLR